MKNLLPELIGTTVPCIVRNGTRYEILSVEVTNAIAEGEAEYYNVSDAPKTVRKAIQHSGVLCNEVAVIGEAIYILE
jgi:hypothetical protein